MAKIISLIKEKYLLNEKAIDKEVLIQKISDELIISKNKVEKKISKLLKNEELILIKPNNISFPIEYDVEEKVGNFILGRKGRTVYIKNTSNTKISDDESIKISEKVNHDLKNTLEELELELLKSDPLKILLYFGKVIGKDHQDFQILLEVLQKIILKHKKENFKFEKDINFFKINSLVEKFKKNIPNYCMFNNLIGVNENLDKKQILMILISHHLIVRGDAYPIHYDFIFKKYFNYTKSCFDFDIIKFYNSMKQIEKQIENNISNPLPTKDKVLNKVKEYILKTKNFNESIVECRKDNPKLFEKSFDEIVNFENIYKIDKTKIKKEYLDLLSLKLGENSDWKNIFDFDKIITKPLIKYDDNYYCFIPQHLLRNKKLILENCVTNVYKEKFKELKGKFYEIEVKKTFEKILDTKNSYTNLYTKEKNSSEKDLIIIKDDILFLIEIKGTKRRLFSSDLNIIEQTKEDYDISIKKAFEQVSNTFDYIQRESEAIFYNSNKKKSRTEILRIKKSDYKNIFKISVHSDNFSSLTANIDLIKEIDKNLYENGKDFWTINLYDLLIFKDIIEKPNDFIDYLEQRLDLNKNKTLISHDEIDFFGYFISEGNLRLSEDIISGSMLSSFSEEFDKYFESLGFGKIEIRKPTRK